MKSLLVSVALGAGFLFSVCASADAPAGSTAECKDGTYYSGTSHKGACHGHQGVKQWLDGSAGAAPATTPAATPAATPATPVAPASTSTTSKKSKSKTTSTTTATTPVTTAVTTTPAATPTPVAPAKPAAPAMTAQHTAPTPASQITQKAGGGPGLVWVNSSSKVYHCQGDEWYGKTKEGSYMSEAQAEAGGSHAAHGKTCGN